MPFIMSSWTLSLYFILYFSSNAVVFSVFQAVIKDLFGKHSSKRWIAFRSEVYLFSTVEPIAIMIAVLTVKLCWRWVHFHACTLTTLTMQQIWTSWASHSGMYLCWDWGYVWYRVTCAIIQTIRETSWNARRMRTMSRKMALVGLSRYQELNWGAFLCFMSFMLVVGQLFDISTRWLLVP